MPSKFELLLQSIQSHSLVEYPKEACGIVTKDFTYIACKNISPKPKTSFIIDPLAILAHEENIWGFYHSHPGSADPIPSKKDIESTVFSQYRFLVGFAQNTYIYWLENNSLKFERFNESHCNLF
jgi:proteasome lid subunit RPN8/RPN11